MLLLLNILNLFRLNSSWTHAAKLSFIENQIKTCIAIKSAIELEHWYSILGVHLSKHGEEKRIRTHLNDLLGTPDTFMELDGEERTKETILVHADCFYFIVIIIILPYQFISTIDLIMCLF